MIVVVYLFIIFILILGILNHPLGILLIIADGFFHLLAGQNVLERSSPDHTLSTAFNRFFQAQGLFDVLGFGVPVHRFMGLSLILLSLYTVYKQYIKGETDLIVKMYMYFIKPLTLTIIALAATVKLYYSIKGDELANNPLLEDRSVAMFRLK